MGLLKLKLALLCLAFCFLENLAAPTDSTLSLVVSSTIPSVSKEVEKEGGTAEAPQATVPKIYQMHIFSKISNRFANTTITSKVRNIADKAQEATFAVVLPETAFISGFIMEIDGKNYTAYVKEKDEAKKDYDQAVASGIGAAHVAVSARDSNRFTVSVNVEPETKAAFYLTYEQLLKRDDGHYEQIININPGQPVKDLSVEVAISESRKILDLKAPPLRSGNEIGNDNSELDPRADIKTINDKEALITFSPNLERQKQLAKLLKTKEDDGFSGQFVVQYDVERDPQGGEVLIQDGYFVHFFAPTELEPLAKHVIFVLDTSGSMYGSKMTQLIEAMNKILKELHAKDIFNLVEFNSNARVWDLNTPNSSVWYPTGENFYYGQTYEEVGFDNFTFPSAYPANPDNIKKAIDTVNIFTPDGGTDILTALKVGLHLVDLAKQKKVDDVERQTILVFLTDGEPTVRESSPEKITDKVTEINTGSRKSPIFTLSFGSGADKKFLQKLSLRNRGFSKHIYEAADAALQLQDFYRQISSPLLADVTFKYEPSVTSLTTTEFPIHFGGSEIVVTGWCGTDLLKPPTIDGVSSRGIVTFKPTVERAVTNVERLWAYLTVRQLLEKKEVSDGDKEDLKKKALDLALKYSFVTPVSSLVVVKPNATKAVDTEDASEGGSRGGYPQYAVVNRIVGGSGGAGASYALSAASPQYFAPAQLVPHTAGAFSQDAGIPLSVGTSRPPATYITSTAPPLPPQTTAAQDLFAKLPWLNDILNKDGSLALSTGNFKLGLNETITDVVDCPKTPLNEAGHCTLLKDCPQVHNLLTTSDIFVQHSCVLKNEFAGICCPVA